MAQIKSNSGHMTSKGQRVIAVSGEMKNIANDMIRLVSNLSNSWESGAATALISKFRKLQDDFEDLRELTVKYGKVATENAQDYDRGDTNVNRMTNDLPTDF